MAPRASNDGVVVKERMTIGELARFLQWDYSKVYRLVRSGKIRCSSKKRGQQMKDRRILLSEAKRIQRLDANGGFV